MKNAMLVLVMLSMVVGYALALAQFTFVWVTR